VLALSYDTPTVTELRVPRPKVALNITEVIPPFPETVRASQNFGSRILGAGSNLVKCA